MPTLRSTIYTIILETLIRHGGNRTHTARELAISIRGLRNYIKEMISAGMNVPVARNDWNIAKTHGFACRCVTCNARRRAKRAERASTPPTHGALLVKSQYCAKCGRIKRSALTYPDGACEKCTRLLPHRVISYCSACGIRSANLISRPPDILCKGCILDKPHPA